MISSASWKLETTSASASTLGAMWRNEDAAVARAERHRDRHELARDFIRDSTATAHASCAYTTQLRSMAHQDRRLMRLGRAGAMNAIAQ